ncbi:POU domain, class 6, transcription factor 1-like isoform X4 [Mytilus trossulus]|uniref:POU domain, class 6, transcription factor 1-like isoform X4 n=1 Tax=Mytilus trossulus TaxID=6551 RepID=UPI003006D566
MDMDGDSSDEVTSEALNGETKPDVAKLAQSAIIKQDVMLSATSTQSPLAHVSSVFTMPTISMPSVSMATSALGGLTDHLFMSHLPSATDSPSHGDGKSDNGAITSMSSPSHLFGQPQVAAPQFFLTGGNQQIQLLTTSNGQIIATNLANIPGLTQPLNLNINSNSSSQSSNSLHNHLSAGLASQLSNLPSLLSANAQSQILALGQQVLNPLTLTPNVTSSSHSSMNGQSRQTSSPTTPKRLSLVSQSPTSTSTIDGLPPSVSQLLPHTVGNSTESTTVDGINLDEIKEFAKQFKIRRLSLGLTQTQVGQALSATEGPAYSQSAICRFEKLDITPKSAQKIKPVLERWMMEAEERYRNGVNNLTDFIGSEPSKKRKRRTSFTPAALEVLNNFFEINTHPSGAEMTELSEKLNYDREVIRVWFCNKRQALKNTIKKLKQETP